MKLSKLSRIIFLLVLGVVFIFGCSSNQPKINTEQETAEKNQNQSEIDELFGIINETDTETETEPATQEQDDAEVLELLGITKKQSEQAAVQETSQADDQLKNEIDTLEQRLADRDAEIADLRSNVAAKDEEIGNLETGTSRKPDASSGDFNLTGSFKQDYQLALQEYNNRNYKVAIQMFEELLAGNSSHSLSDNCRYWIGESYYGLGNFNQAIIEFTKVFSFTKSNKMDAAQLKLGLCYLRLDDREKAAQEFERLISDYPDSEFVEKAQYFLTKL